MFQGQPQVHDTSFGSMSSSEVLLLSLIDSS